MGLCPDRFCRGVGRGVGRYDPEFSGKEAEAGKVGREKKRMPWKSGRYFFVSVGFFHFGKDLLCGFVVWSDIRYWLLVLCELNSCFGMDLAVFLGERRR